MLCQPSCPWTRLSGGVGWCAGRGRQHLKFKMGILLKAGLWPGAPSPWEASGNLALRRRNLFPLFSHWGGSRRRFGKTKMSLWVDLAKHSGMKLLIPSENL